MSLGRMLILGAGGHGVSLAETTTACGYDLIAFVDPREAGRSLLGREILPDIPDGYLESGGALVLAIGDNAARESGWLRVRDRIPHPERQVPTLVHPSASVSSFAAVGPGTVVMQRAVVGSGAVVGDFCLLNTGSILEHEGVLADFASLAPGATVGGRVGLGTRSAISIGCTVKHGVTIGKDCVVGAHSYLSTDLGDGVVAYGSPARVIRTRERGESYLH